MVTAKAIRDQVLKERGLDSIQPVKRQGKAKEFRRKRPTSTVADNLKTDKMRWLELKHHKAIEEILTVGSLSAIVGAVKGDIDTSTASKWIKRLRLRWSESNLPNCDICKHWRTTQCTEGVCAILVEAEEFELALVKRRQVRGE